MNAGMNEAESFPQNATDKELAYFIEVTAWALGMAVAEQHRRKAATV